MNKRRTDVEPLLKTPVRVPRIFGKVGQPRRGGGQGSKRHANKWRDGVCVMAVLCLCVCVFVCVCVCIVFDDHRSIRD